MFLICCIIARYHFPISHYSFILSNLLRIQLFKGKLEVDSVILFSFWLVGTAFEVTCDVMRMVLPLLRCSDFFYVAPLCNPDWLWTHHLFS